VAIGIVCDAFRSRFKSSNLILSHLFPFLGRLSFIFGGTLFSVVFFGHLPALDNHVDALLNDRTLATAGRCVVYAFLLMALFAAPPPTQLTLSIQRTTIDDNVSKQRSLIFKRRPE